jgi:hypothetical protein
MNAPKGLKPRRPSPAAALVIAQQAAPEQPPAVVPIKDHPTTLNLRVRSTTVSALTTAARERGLTLKQIICQSLAAAGVSVDPADLENRTPRRRT